MFSLKSACLCTASLVALTTSAFAQAGDALPETVVVTGSRVIADIANSPTPVTAVTAAQLTTTTPSSISAALNKLPVFMGSTGGQTRPGSTANGAANNLNLRNFGTNRLLVVLDNHRLINTQATGAVNIDVLPEMLISRVDVVTGGASAVYGSDAVTGVVNFILDKSYEGIKYQGNVGANEKLQAPQYQFGVAAGTRLFGGRGHIEGTFRFHHIDRVPVRAMPYARDGNAWAYAGNGTAANPYFLAQNVRRNDDPMGGLILCGNSRNGGTPQESIGGAGWHSTGPACSVDGQTFIQNGIIGPYDQGKVLPQSNINLNGSTLSSGGTGRRDLFTDFNAGQNTIQSFGRFSYNINDNVVAAIQLRAAQSGYFGIGPNNGLPPSTTGSPRPTFFAVTNPFLSAANQAALAKGNPGCPGGVPTDISIAPNCIFQFTNYWATLDGVAPGGNSGASGQQNSVVKDGLPTFNYKALDRNMAFMANLTGQLDGAWDWDLFYSHDEARSAGGGTVNQNFQETYAALDAVLVNGKPKCYVSTTAFASLYPNCDPLNPFGPTAATATQYASFTHPTPYVVTNTMDDLGASIAGSIFDLPAGAVKGALSGEARWLNYSVKSAAEPSFTNCTGLRASLCNTLTPVWYQTTLANITPKSQMVYEFAAEVNVPLIKDVPLIQDLSLNAAGRHTDYSVSGAVQTWKLGFDYHVMDDFKFRGTMSVDIRAPTMDDLYKPFANGNSSLNDRLTGKSADVTAYSGGNTNLVPEVAHTYTVGTVISPTFIDNLQLSVDYYRINLAQAITAITYTDVAIQTICINSGGTSVYCSLANRPLPFSNTTTANFPNFITNQSLNSATQKTEGVDVEVLYNFDLEEAIGVPGAINVRNLFSYQPYITQIAFAGASPLWTAMPKSRNTLFVGYKLGNWSVNLQDRWLGGYNQNTTTGQFFRSKQDRHIPSYNQVDMTITKSFTVDDSVLDGYISITDITDAIYPVAPASLTGGASNPGQYPIVNWGYGLGRAFTIGIRGSL